MNEVIFPGSFDPITNGHVDIIKRALPLFKKIVVAVGINSNKKYMFELEDRISFINDTFKNEKKIEVKSYDGLTVDFCKKNNIKVILRGLRNPDDFEFEKSITHTNRTLSNIETVFLLTSSDVSFVSSSIVREVIKNKGNYKHFVPKSVILKN
tara:strand:- start:92320 stop:92778 length:459 start_codon:yes stop_codon:yes gene_type:complete